MERGAVPHPAAAGELPLVLMRKRETAALSQRPGDAAVGTGRVGPELDPARNGGAKLI